MNPTLILSALLLIGLTAASTLAAPPPAAALECTTSREYITALEFIRSRPDLAILDQDAQKVATQVSQGCTDAAQRFIKVTSLLIHAGMTGRNAVQLGLEHAQKTNAHTDTFILVFKRAFLEDYLDLDLKAAVEMANSLTAEFDTNLETARADFDRFLRFCMGSKDLNLPRPQCGAFAARLTRIGIGSKKGAFSPFQQAFEFLGSSAGPRLTTGDALKTAENLVAAGPLAVDNFIQAYRYGISPKGLNLDAHRAVSFATQLATSKKTGNP